MILKYKFIIYVLILTLLSVLILGCNAKDEKEATIEETTDAQVKTTEETTTEEVLPSVTAMGITVPQKLADTGIDIYDCVFF